MMAEHLHWVVWQVKVRTHVDGTYNPNGYIFYSPVLYCAVQCAMIVFVLYWKANCCYSENNQNNFHVLYTGTWTENPVLPIQTEPPLPNYLLLGKITSLSHGKVMLLLASHKERWLAREFMDAKIKKNSTGSHDIAGLPTHPLKHQLALNLSE